MNGLRWDRDDVRGFYRHCLDDLDEEGGPCLLECFARFEDCARFDCKDLPEDFLIQTGEEREAELLESGEAVKLPFESCVLEFPSAFLLASQSGWHSGDEQHDSIRCFALPHWKDRLSVIGSSPMADLLNQFAEFRSRALYEKMDEDEPPEARAMWPYTPVGLINESGEVVAADFLRRGAMLLLGLTVLFEERLLRDVAAVGATKRENLRRVRAGERVVPDYRVLTLNLAEAKRRAQAPALGAHESPLLHWRRGHWRTLGRLSEFEKRVWVRRALVGDPSKGFVTKHYRPIWRPEIH